MPNAHIMSMKQIIIAKYHKCYFDLKETLLLP